MFAKLHLLSQDVPEGGKGLRWQAHPYLHMAGGLLKGPAVFEWNARQRTDLEALWRDPATEGARERLAEDLAVFCGKLGWSADTEMLADAEKRGGEYMLTLSAVPSELYLLPWEVIHAGEDGMYLSDHANALVRYAMPGLEPREVQTAPPSPGVLFAWSRAGGEVPHAEQAAAIRAAAEAGGVAFRELAEVDEASLQAALDAGAPSVLHLLCHGLPGREGEPSRLKWGTSDQPSEITALRLSKMLRHRDRALRLVVLSACGSGDGHGDPLLMGSLAQELHKKGIRSVVASRYPLSVPGSRAMTKALYDKMLREAWSLERALRATRQALLRVGEDGEAHPGDAYGIQLYAYDTERFVSDNGLEAERPVLASYPFGTAACPVPEQGPPRVELTLSVGARPRQSRKQMEGALRRVSEDDRLTVAVTPEDDKGTSRLKVLTTVDGAQRLLGGWRSQALSVAIGVIVLGLVKTADASPLPPIKPPIAPGHPGPLARIAATVAKLVTAKLAIVALISIMAAVGVAAVRRPPAPAVCGNGKLEAGEQCDDGNARSGDGCSSTCQHEPRACGNGRVDPGEECDDGNARSGDGCSSTCQHEPRACGNGRVDPGEECDDGNTRNGDGCSSTCLIDPVPMCGNGQVEVGEQCDDGNLVDGDGCSSVCRTESPVCGNGIIEADEQCDDGNTRNGDGCSSTCKHEPAPVCGNGKLEAGEACDDGNAVGGDGCSSTCQRELPPVCGNGKLEVGEECDDGNTADGDGCSSRCKQEPPVCGNGTLEAGEDCDDGNVVNRDGCSSTCRIEPAPVCGNGKVEAGESCDDGNVRDGDGCSSTCQTEPPVCGNGKVEAGESCDDGNVRDGDGCSSTCQTEAPVCGNGKVETGETCDDGNTRNGDGCSSTCQTEVVRRSVEPVNPAVQVVDKFQSIHNRHRISGKTNILPSKETRFLMQERGERSVTGLIELCVSADGSVTSTRTQETTGYDDYDAKLLRTIHDWRYQPLLVKGSPQPVCDTVKYVFSFR